MKKIITMLFMIFAISCTDPKTTRKVLEVNGYRNIEVKGWAFFGCSKDDTFTTQFEAISPSGKHVSGVVCSDWFKGATIRFD